MKPMRVAVNATQACRASWLAALLGALAMLGGTAGAPAADVYRWQDAQGRVQYGDVVPPGYEGAAREVAVPEVTPEQRRAAEVLAARERAELAGQDNGGAGKGRSAANLPQESGGGRRAAGTGSGAFTRTAAGEDPAVAACTAAWHAYRESVACFARFKLRNGGVRPEAFSVCKQLLQPSCNEPALPPQPNSPARTPHD